jgi:membrane-associated PAP2 superfamily phosphatase
MRPGDAATRRQFLLTHLVPLLPVAALLIVLDFTAVDDLVSGWFFDPAAMAFPLRYDAALEVMGHQWPKAVVILVECGVVGLWLLSFVVPQLEPRRRLLLYLSLGLALAPLAVVLLRNMNPRHCPWSMREYGGFAEHLALLAFTPPGTAPGHCFPAGHASTGFCLFAFYFAGRALGSPWLRRAGFWGSLLAGLALGLVRVAQGAHFLSHVLWTGVVCWGVLTLLYAAFMEQPRGLTRVSGLAPGRQHDADAGARLEGGGGLGRHPLPRVAGAQRR